MKKILVIFGASLVSGCCFVKVDLTGIRLGWLDDDYIWKDGKIVYQENTTGLSIRWYPTERYVLPPDVTEEKK